VSKPSSITTCYRCEKAAGPGERFCSACGANLFATPWTSSFRRWSWKQRGILLAFTAGAFFSAYGIQNHVHSKRGEVKPTVKYKPPEDNGALEDKGDSRAGQRSTAASIDELEGDPQLKALKADLEKDPQDMKRLKAVAVRMGDLLRENTGAPSDFVFEAIDIFGRILKIEPNDPDGLVMMADVSFDQRAFAKALEFYERYLRVEPTDLGARSRYASTLTFLGRFDDSIKELQSVIDKDQKNFPAMAYLAITYAQKGDVAKAKEVGQKALDVAPSDEARQRFTGFMRSLDGESQGKMEGVQRAGGPSVGATTDGANAVVNAVRTNPVAGTKFVRADDKDPTVLKLYFKDFPMQAMPPFAKQKFFSGLQDRVRQAKLTELRRIDFIDADTGQPLDTMQIPKE